MAAGLGDGLRMCEAGASPGAGLPPERSLTVEPKPVGGATATSGQPRPVNFYEASPWGIFYKSTELNAWIESADHIDALVRCLVKRFSDTGDVVD